MQLSLHQPSRVLDLLSETILGSPALECPEQPLSLTPLPATGLSKMIHLFFVFFKSLKSEIWKRDCHWNHRKAIELEPLKRFTENHPGNPASVASVGGVCFQASLGDCVSGGGNSSKVETSCFDSGTKAGRTSKAGKAPVSISGSDTTWAEKTKRLKANKEAQLFGSIWWFRIAIFQGVQHVVLILGELHGFSLQNFKKHVRNKWLGGWTSPNL